MPKKKKRARPTFRSLAACRITGSQQGRCSLHHRTSACRGEQHTATFRISRVAFPSWRKNMAAAEMRPKNSFQNGKGKTCAMPPFDQKKHPCGQKPQPNPPHPPHSDPNPPAPASPEALGRHRSPAAWTPRCLSASHARGGQMQRPPPPPIRTWNLRVRGVGWTIFPLGIIAPMHVGTPSNTLGILKLSTGNTVLINTLLGERTRLFESS